MSAFQERETKLISNFCYMPHGIQPRKISLPKQNLAKNGNKETFNLIPWEVNEWKVANHAIC